MLQGRTRNIYCKSMKSVLALYLCVGVGVGILLSIFFTGSRVRFGDFLIGALIGLGCGFVVAVLRNYLLNRR